MAKTVTDIYGAEHTLPGPFHTISDLRAANLDAGRHFFAPSTLRFFRSRIAPGVIAGRVFVTSEQFVPYDGDPEPRRYTVRLVTDNGDTADVSQFQQFDTLPQARAFARTVTA